MVAQDFIDGKILRNGESSLDTEYKVAVDTAQSGIDVPASQSAYFDEQALDPYEVSNAKQFI